MEIKDKQVNGVTVLLLTGSIDAMTAPKITEFINDKFESKDFIMSQSIMGCSRFYKLSQLTQHTDISFSANGMVPCI